MISERIALTGGIGSGKTTVARMFADLGAVIVDADETARQVVQPGTSCWQKLRDLLSEKYFESDGRLNRSLLREKIVQDSEARRRIEAVLHPAILEAMERQWEKHRRETPRQPVLFDVPLLYEAKLSQNFDRVILVYVPRQVQLERLMDRDTLSRAEAEKTLAMQLPIEAKKEWADIVIDNAQDLHTTRRQVRAVWNDLIKDSHLS